MNGTPWIEEQRDYLRMYYADSRTSDLVEKAGHHEQSILQEAARLGLKKSKKFYDAHFSGRLRAETGIEGRFKNGGVPWNKGMKGLRIGGKGTQFKKGNRPGNCLPIGSVVIRSDGYSKTKIADPNKWELTHVLTWMQAGNDRPHKSQVIRFKDGNALNCNDINNLELCTKADMMAANSVQKLPDELRKTIQLFGVLKRKLNARK